MRLPIKASEIQTVIINPQPHRRIEDDLNFVVIGKKVGRENRYVEFHISDDELRKLIDDGVAYLARKNVTNLTGEFSMTKILSYADS